MMPENKETIMKKYKLCPACGTKNSPGLLECVNCKNDITGARITDEDKEAAVERKKLEHQDSEQDKILVEDNDDDDDNDEPQPWSKLLENIQDTVNVEQSTNPESKNKKEVRSGSNDDDEENSGGVWEALFGGDKTVAEKVIMTAIRYGTLTFSVTVGDLKADDQSGVKKYWLGRSENQSSFLSQDGRVGNRHCYLFRRNENWYVKDSSQNGTFVNGADIGEYGEHLLRNGDILTLGHNADSAAFKVELQ